MTVSEQGKRSTDKMARYWEELEKRWEIANTVAAAFDLRPAVEEYEAEMFGDGERKACGNCAFADNEVDAGFMFCRRHAPRAVCFGELKGRMDAAIAIWPSVDRAVDWCGEFQPVRDAELIAGVRKAKERTTDRTEMAE